MQKKSESFKMMPPASHFNYTVSHGTCFFKQTFAFVFCLALYFACVQEMDGYRGAYIMARLATIMIMAYNDLFLIK